MWMNIPNYMGMKPSYATDYTKLISEYELINVADNEKLGAEALVKQHI